MKNTSTAENKLRELGITLPPPCQAAGNYRPALLVGNLLYVSGHTPDDADATPGAFRQGKVGYNVSQDQAYDDARKVALAILSTVKAALGSLDRVKRLVRATGVVNSTSDFTSHPKVMNGFSDLMAKVFGAENGVGTRSATGVTSLPGGVAVEVTECIFEVFPEPTRKRPVRSARMGQF